MENRQKVLFIGHDASRTGAAVLLLELIKWLATHSSFQPSVLLKRGGELEPNYHTIAPTRCYAEENDKLNRGVHRRVLRTLRPSRIRQPDLASLYPPKEYPVVYANTIDTCDIAMQLAGPGRSLVHHIHELSHATDSLGAAEMLSRAVPKTDLYIAASQTVGEFLKTKIGVPRAKLQVVHSFAIAITPKDHQDETRKNLRRRLGISDDDFVVGMCGSPQWRKGTDLFVQLAAYVKRYLGLAKCHFVWVGGNSNSHRDSLYDVAQLGLQDIFHFIPAVPNPEAYFRVFDLFSLTSREEPFSVAMLQAAACGLPIVCFAGAGGAVELVENDAGIVVPYLDVSAMAKACVDLLLNANLRGQLGDKARAKVESRYLLALQGPKVLAVLETAASRAKRSHQRR